MSTPPCDALVLLVLSLAVTPVVSGQCPECGPDAISEEEPNCGLNAAGEYDDFVNGGCFAVEPQFTPIELGQTLCGTAAMNTTTGVRDTDWYELVLAEETELIWFFSAEFRSLIGVVDNAGVPDCADAHCFLTGGEVRTSFPPDDDCYPGRITVLLPAGTWWFFVAPIFEDEVACEFQYTSRVVERLPADLNGDGVVTHEDLDYLIWAWGINWPDADLDGDGTVGILDLLLLLALWPI